MENEDLLLNCIKPGASGDKLEPQATLCLQAKRSIAHGDNH